jgi:signal peptide peptidase-like protein 2B
VYAVFSKLPPPVEGLIAWLPVGNGSLGCEPFAPAPAHAVAIVRRGVCSFVTKALHAQTAGARGVIVVSDDEFVPLMGSGDDEADALTVNIFMAGIQKSLGDKLIDHVKGGQDPLVMNFSIYTPQVWNVSELILISMATFLVVAGAFFATADMRVGSPLAPQAHEEVLEVDNESAMGFCVFGSIMLVVLFFLMKYMIYCIIVAFCLGGLSCITQIGSSCLGYLVPSMRKSIMTLPEIGNVSPADLVSLLFAAVLVGTWVVLRNSPYGWIFQDMIGAGFLCSIQRTLRLPNIQVATLLLSVMFFFDIFWVFISPLFFHKSVMVEVARGGGTGESVPMLLRLPAIGDQFGSDRMLGFGDVALPGLLISYLRRHDLLSQRSGCRGYFVPAVIGYFVGLCVTIVALTIMQMGQPALLYLVPGTLGTTQLLGAVRGETCDLWNGTPRVSESSNSEDKPDHELLSA